MTKSSDETLTKRLEWITICWNVFEGLMALVIGLQAGSVALFGFGLDSSLEVFVSILVLWQLNRPAREKDALRAIGYAYVLVSIYIGIDSVQAIITHRHSEHSLVGVIGLVLTVIIMFVLAKLKFQVADRTHNAALAADAEFSLIDGFVAASVLAGLAANLWFNIWWLDQVLGLGLALFVFKEGFGRLKQLGIMPKN